MRSSPDLPCSPPHESRARAGQHVVQPSPSIQRQFGSPADFLAMVMTAYRPVHRPREVQFGDLVEVAGEPVQLVLLVGPDFDVVTAYYAMQRQADGSWRIDGCVLRTAPDQAT